MADAEALGHLLGDQVLPGAEPTLEHIGEHGFHDRLATQAALALQSRSRVEVSHGFWSAAQ